MSTTPEDSKEIDSNKQAEVTSDPKSKLKKFLNTSKSMVVEDSSAKEKIEEIKEETIPEQVKSFKAEKRDNNTAALKPTK